MNKSTLRPHGLKTGACLGLTPSIYSGQALRGAFFPILKGGARAPSNRSRATRYALWPFLWLIVICVTVGCVSVRLMAEYDRKIDDGITELQRKTEAFLIKMERIAETPEGAYPKHIGFYDEVKVDLSALRVRADAIALNDLTSQQIGLLQDSFRKLEEQHQKGLKAVLIESIRPSLNTQFTTILKLEVAKKRDRTEGKRK